MDKPVKENTVDAVLERLQKTAGNIEAVAQLYAEENNSEPEALSVSMLNSLKAFFGDYGIQLPSGEDIREGLEEALKEHGQKALDAMEGVHRLANKVVYFTYETEDTKAHLDGLLASLSGLPLEQLGSTPDKPKTVFSGRTYRDKISDLLTIGKGVEENYMLKLLPKVLPEEARKAREQGAENYIRFLDELFDQINGVYELYMEGKQMLTPFGHFVEDMLPITVSSDNFSGNGHEKLTPKILEEFSHTADPRSALENFLRGRILAVGYSGHNTGAKRKVIIATNDGRDGRINVSYNSSRGSRHVVEALQAINEECGSALKPSDSLYELNFSGRNLHHLAER
ncbi:hypothetical protein JXB11_02880 [Candidatus Woesearchaeota archaeon]|nr:hypothetical protein [Candidatus Woesearchaeota archaeon]